MSAPAAIAQAQDWRADFPALQQESQPSLINKIFYAKDDPLKPKSHEVVKQDNTIQTTRNYKKFAPGTAGWMIVWKSHPDLQEEMVEFKRKYYLWCPIREQRLNYEICKNNQEKY